MTRRQHRKAVDLIGTRLMQAAMGGIEIAMQQAACDHLFSIPDSSGLVECLFCADVNPDTKKLVSRTKSKKVKR